MPVIVVANPKGGAGKSTLATHVAGFLAAAGRDLAQWQPLVDRIS